MMIPFTSGICDQFVRNTRLSQNQCLLIYNLLWWFIIFVSVIDGYLMFEYQKFVRELNPIGQWLIELNRGQVWYLLALKFAGTVAACAILDVIFSRCHRTGMIMASAVGLFQGWLLLFLFLA